MSWLPAGLCPSRGLTALRLPLTRWEEKAVLPEPVLLPSQRSATATPHPCQEQEGGPELHQPQGKAPGCAPAPLSTAAARPRPRAPAQPRAVQITLTSAFGWEGSPLSLA